MFSVVYPAFQIGIVSHVFKIVSKSVKCSVSQKIIQSCIKNPNNTSGGNSFFMYSNYFFAGCCFSKSSKKSSECSLLLSDSNEKFGDNVSKAQESEKTAGGVSALIMEQNTNHKHAIEECDHDSNTFNQATKRLKCDNISDFSTGEIVAAQKIVKNTDFNELNCDFTNALPADVKRDFSRQDDTKKGGKESRKPKQRPNYFVAVKISDCKIHNALKEVQDHMLDQDQHLKPIMISLPTLHITLMVMYIGDEDTHQRALHALEGVQQKFDEVMSKEPLKIEIKGLGNFGNKVLFAKISNNEAFDRLSNLAESVNEHFEAVSIFSTDTRRCFNPHLTVAKVTFDKKCRNIRKINPSLYSCYDDQYFGLQTIKSIQLLSMTKPKDINGYYAGDEFFFSAFTPVSLEHRLNLIQDKKKEVREKIRNEALHLTK